jgi:hypothetical protein
VIQLPYYRKTNPIISANARYVIREILGTSAPGVEEASSRAPGTPGP